DHRRVHLRRDAVRHRRAAARRADSGMHQDRARTLLRRAGQARGGLSRATVWLQPGGLALVRTDYDPLPAAYRTQTEASLPGGRVRKRAHDLLNLVPAIKRKVRCKASIAVGIPPVCEQYVSYSIGTIHDVPRPAIMLLEGLYFDRVRTGCDIFISWFDTRRAMV